MFQFVTFFVLFSSDIVIYQAIICVTFHYLYRFVGVKDVEHPDSKISLSLLARVHEFGCFTGDTRIPLVNGDIRALKELAESKECVWVYAIDENTKETKIAKACAGLVKENSELVDIL